MITNIKYKGSSFNLYKRIREDNKIECFIFFDGAVASDHSFIADNVTQATKLAKATISNRLKDNK